LVKLLDTHWVDLGVEFTKIAFTSDFGYRDHYVAVVKATILSRVTRSVTFVDVTHDVGRQNVRRAAYAVGVSGKYLGEDTVHLVVVDPTVGTDRRIVVFKPRDHCVFVAPDNGVLTLAYEWFRGEVYYAKPPSTPVSHTFHARDVFAPLVAEIVEGRLREHVEPASLDAVVKLNYPAYERLGDRVHGCVLLYGCVRRRDNKHTKRLPRSHILQANHERRRIRCQPSIKLQRWLSTATSLSREAKATMRWL